MVETKTVTCQRNYVIAAESFWYFLRDFYADWHPAMAWCTRDSENVRRFAGSDDGTIYREQLLELNDAELCYRYVVLEGIAGIASYHGELKVVANGTGCMVVHSAEIVAQQPRLDDVASGTEFIFNMGLDALERIVAEQLTVHTQFIDGDPKLAVDVVGAGELVLFLHGIGGGRSNWRGQLAALAPICRAVALDFRGYGNSDLGDEQPTAANQVEDIRRLMRHFDVERVHLIGLSYGSWIAACFAHLYPEHVASLTCCAGSTGMSEADEDEISRFRELRLVPMEAGQTPADIAEGVVTFISGPQSSDAVRGALLRSMRSISRQTYVAALRCFLDPPFKIEFEQFRFPTQFIAGEHDKLAPPAEMGEVASRVPNADCLTIEGVGHLINLEQPRRFNQILCQFIWEQIA